MTREEAIEIMRKNMPSDNSLPVYEALHTLIPELAESEDERIKNSLLEFLDDVWHMGKNANFDRWGKADCADWIAYLEKQEDFELSEEDKKIIPEALVMLCDDIINHRVHTPIKTDEEGARKIKAFLKTFNRQPHKTKEEWEKRKEQKPVEQEQPKMNIPSAKSGAIRTTPPKFKLDVKQDLPADLEKEIQEYLEKLGGGHGGFVDDLIDDDLTGFALHFYRLGLKARNKENKGVLFHDSMTLNDLIRKANALAGQLSSGDLGLRLIDAITADAHGRKVKDIVLSPYSEDGMMKVGISFVTEEKEELEEVG